MPRPKIKLSSKIKDIIQHVGPLPAEANVPIAHYRRYTNDLWNLWNYVERKLHGSNYYPAVLDEHLFGLNNMVMLNLIEAFERFLKEIAATCIDRLAPYITDDRLNTFSASGSIVAAHFQSDTLGKALAESSAWLNCNLINDKFSKLLADPFGSPTFELFPKPTKKNPSNDTFDTMSVMWQIRHTIVHNVGVITKSDALTFQRLVKETVSAPVVLKPTRDDVRYAKRFLDETATDVNRRVATRLSELLTMLHTTVGALMDAQQLADQLAKDFELILSVDGKTGAP